ncbi:hypothetical protein NQ314_020772 [Rhamnusium bicolor]|uniref:Rab-GAP TBC domain-containing protein n=1 Tax=Rhamnusium bicolor TaxID=1586634 RepID=A0AAV8WJH7_9CUCU|nr:hypothetical protein NQ314_020772 [Rhamnusium bicolor]
MGRRRKVPFGRKNIKTVPGRPSPKRDAKNTTKGKTPGTTSFQDFQASVSDAWDMDDDEFCVLSALENTKISKKVSQSAALNVLNTHRSTAELEVCGNERVNEKPHIIPEADTIKISRIPGRPRQLHCFNPPQEEDNESKLERFEALLENSPSLQELSKLSWSGVPVKHDETNRDIQHQINIDVPRMNPSIALFQQRTVQIMFERILFIWSIRHPASGYVQGINDLVTPFYVVFLQEFIPDNQPFEKFNVDTLTQEELKIIEADSFWCLSKFLDGIQDNYVFAQIGIQKKVLQLEELIKRVDEVLHKHLKQHNLYVCASFLLHWKEDLMQEHDFQGLLLLLQNLPTHSWTSSQISMLVAEAYKLKVMFADAPNHLLNNTGDS